VTGAAEKEKKPVASAIIVLLIIVALSLMVEGALIKLVPDDIQLGTISLKEGGAVIKFSGGVALFFLIFSRITSAFKVILTIIASLGFLIFGAGLFYTSFFGLNDLAVVTQNSPTVRLEPGYPTVSQQPSVELPTTELPQEESQLSIHRSAQNLVDQSRITLDHLRASNEFGNARELIRGARAVLIVPRVVKAGFFQGNAGGNAVMLARSASGTWTDPVFYTLTSGSFGWQISIDAAEAIIIVNTDAALTAIEQDQFKFGTRAGLNAVTLGTEAGAASRTQLNSADIIVWSSPTDAYAGIILGGSVVKPSASYNEAYYGHPIAARDILHMSNRGTAGADDLRAKLH